MAKANKTASQAGCWLVKQEPGSYSWDDLMRERETKWTGVRNFQARNHLRAMKKGDQVLFYHSGEEKEVVGIAKVAKAAYADPTAEGEDWSCVDLAPVKALTRPVTLKEIRATAALAEMVLVKNSRLSVQPVTAAEFAVIVRLAG